jgi:hypothetical protein
MSSQLSDIKTLFCDQVFVWVSDPKLFQSTLLLTQGASFLISLSHCGWEHTSMYFYKILCFWNIILFRNYVYFIMNGNANFLASHYNLFFGITESFYKCFMLLI